MVRGEVLVRRERDVDRPVKKQQGRPLDATAQFDEAISLARENPAYPLALAEALEAAGRLPEAEATLSELLERDGTGGAPNLAMARVQAKEGRLTDAAPGAA